MWVQAFPLAEKKEDNNPGPHFKKIIRWRGGIYWSPGQPLELIVCSFDFN